MEEKSFEAGIKELEACIQEMEKATSLEATMALYQKAKQRAKELEARLDQAELIVQDLNGDAVPVKLEKEGPHA